MVVKKKSNHKEFWGIQDALLPIRTVSYRLGTYSGISKVPDQRQGPSLKIQRMQQSVPYVAMVGVPVHTIKAYERLEVQLH